MGEENRAAPKQGPAPDAQAIREGVLQTVGFIPNAVDKMLVSPAVTAVVLSAKKLMAGASLDAREQHAIELYTAVRASCPYCRTWHVGLGLRAGLPADQIRLIEAGSPPTDERLRRLLWATELVMTKGTAIDDADLVKLGEVGIDRAQLYEIVALVAMNVITNTINSIARTLPDERFVGALERASAPAAQ